MPQLLDYLGEWEGWAAELMETHLSYPVIGYYRSQHLAQNWLAALTAVLDACALLAAATPVTVADQATLTFALSRHAVSDLTYTFGASTSEVRPPLSDEHFAELYALLEASGLPIEDAETTRGHLDELRAMYEPQVAGISQVLYLPLPEWMSATKPVANWHAETVERGQARGPLT
jgi:hypothetical protein